MKKIVYAHIIGPKFMAIIDFTSMGEKTLVPWQMVFGTPGELVEVIKTFKADKGLEQNIMKLDAYLSGSHKGRLNSEDRFIV